MIEGPNFELGNEEQKAESKDYLYQNAVVKMVGEYYEDKYADLEKKRTAAEGGLERVQSEQFQRDFSCLLGNDEPMKAGELEGQQNPRNFGLPDSHLANAGQRHINIDSLLNNKGQATQGLRNQMNATDSLRQDLGPIGQNTGAYGDRFDPYLNSTGFNARAPPNHQSQYHKILPGENEARNQLQQPPD
jgi:hypothetical protein